MISLVANLSINEGWENLMNGSLKIAMHVALVIALAGLMCGGTASAQVKHAITVEDLLKVHRISGPSATASSSAPMSSMCSTASG